MNPHILEYSCYIRSHESSHGHIAFNEPYSSLTSRTRVKTLPILHVAAKEYLVGIDELTFDASNAPSGRIAVYNLSGQLVKAAEGKS